MLKDVGERLVRGLLFSEEAPLDGAVVKNSELLSKVVDGASGGDLILPDSVDEFHIFNDLSQAAVAL